MKLVKVETLNTKQGNLLLVYSMAGTGKTVTVLQTCADPVVYLTAEGRKISTSMAAIARPGYQNEGRGYTVTSKT